MEKEQLIELGVPVEVVDAVAEASKSELKGFIPKNRFDEVNNAKNNLTAQLDEVNKTIEILKANNADNAELQKTIADKDNAIKSLEEKHAEHLKKVKIDHAVENALIKAKAKNVTATKALLDLEKAEFSKDGDITNLDALISEIKESEAYLFGDERVVGSKPKDPVGSPSSVEKSLGARMAEARSKENDTIIDPWSNN